MNAENQPQASVCAVILAGGRGMRMGGVDKGLQGFRGMALAQHALQRLQTQSGLTPTLIGVNANRNTEAYAQWGLPVWPDTVSADLPEFAGPLVGFLTAMRHAQATHTHLLTVPCDSPLFPLDLLERMHTAMAAASADIAVAVAPERQADGSATLRTQPVFCLLKTTLADSLQNYLVGGGRKIDTWLNAHPLVEVAFDTARDDPLAFANANTLDELHALERV